MTDTEEKTPKAVTFRYIKDNHFRVAHASGFIGSLTPRNDIFVSFFNERFALPDSFVFEVRKDGKLGEEISADQDEPSDVIRNVDFGVLMDVDTAGSLIVWLNEMIQKAELRVLKVAENPELEVAEK